MTHLRFVIPLQSLVERDPFRKPVSTFRDHALTQRRGAAMPLDFCHPEAPHKKLKIPEWYVSSLMLDRALDAIVRRVKKFDRRHDIPYLAGYSRDGKTIYIDRHM